jgi:chemotaxis protein methyltransferase CheR
MAGIGLDDMIVERDEFLQFAWYIRDISGIILDDSKLYIVENRFDSLCRELGCRSIRDLYLKARSDPNRTVERKIIDLITTHETFFFRDENSFKMLSRFAAEWYFGRKGFRAESHIPLINIWCAGCSTGQEIYSAAMALRETLYSAPLSAVRILGTDISDECISKASYGRYTQFEVERGLSPERLERCFKRDGAEWRIRDEIRSMVTFKRLNLMNDFSFLTEFDAILCRNVAIYFSPEDRKNLFERMAAHMNRDSVMILGLTETMHGVTNQLFRMESDLGVYYRRAY